MHGYAAYKFAGTFVRAQSVIIRARNKLNGFHERFVMDYSG
jgi:hypothetical protein